jgi:hypothetical protein
LLFTEPGFALKHGRKALKERFRALIVLELRRGRYIFLQNSIVGVDRVKLPPSLRVREDVHSFLNALEEVVVVGFARDTGFFVWVVLENLFTIWNRRQNCRLDEEDGNDIGNVGKKKAHGLF